ncbi:MAG: Flp family type IVb pilin [Rhizobiaceae bacterium]
MTKSFPPLIMRFLSDQRGAAMVEYALLLGLISIGAITFLTLIGAQITEFLGNVYEALGGDPDSLVTGDGS